MKIIFEGNDMRLGKISENVLKRSVLKLIQTHREEVIKGAELGSDCAFFSCPSQDDIVLTTDSVTYSKKNAGMLGVHRVANDIAAAGATPVGILVDILFSERDREAKLKDIMNQMEAPGKTGGFYLPFAPRLFTYYFSGLSLYLEAL